ncbi:MAG: UdgX family uracil-DNA binding protein [Chloroflexi bacterium]|nr:MAG: UdgX family uracil-DNA binding protein [Chloroflexota bacterium]
MQRFRKGAHPTRLWKIRDIAFVEGILVSEQASRTYPQPENPRSLRSVEAAAKGCRACELWRLGTQTVFGSGPRDADVVFVGEQPGDVEDREGEPFVGPAGRILDEALSSAGIDRSRVYVTNAVKHFKWKPKGKRRIHDKPNTAQVAACQHWLELELRLVKPSLVVALGATAAQALLGPKFRVTVDRGKVRSAALAPRVVATVHPSSILRAQDDESRHEEMAAFIRDLRVVKKLLNET